MSDPVKVEPLSTAQVLAEKVEWEEQKKALQDRYITTWALATVDHLFATMDAKEGELAQINGAIHCQFYHCPDHPVESDGCSIVDAVKALDADWQRVREENAHLERERITAVSALEWEKSTHAAFVAVHHATVEKIAGERDLLQTDLQIIRADYVETLADLAKEKETHARTHECWRIGNEFQENTIKNLQADLTKAREENGALRDWRSKVTASLGRPGGAFYEDVAKHVAEQSLALAAADEATNACEAALEFLFEERRLDDIQGVWIQPGWLDVDKRYDDALDAYRALRPEAKGAESYADHAWAPKEWKGAQTRDPRMGRWVCADKCGYEFVGTPMFNPFMCQGCIARGNNDVTMIQAESFYPQPAPETCKVDIPTFKLGEFEECGNPLPCAIPGHAETKR